MTPEIDQVLQKLTSLEALLKAQNHAAATGAGVSSQHLRVQKCTQAEFDRLPGLVSRQEFLTWTGYNPKDLQEEITAKRIDVYRPKGHGKNRYYKREIARLGGWKM